MATPLDTPQIVAPAASKVVAALVLPPGKVTAPGTNVAGGTVTGTATVPAGATKIYVGLAESPATAYAASADIGGTALPETDTGRTYTLEARVVAPATDMTSYTAIAAAFEAATAPNVLAYTRDVPGTLLGGMLRAGAWTLAADFPLIESKAAGLTFAAGRLQAQLTGDGLDLISGAEPTAKPTTFVGKMLWGIQRMWRAEMTATTLTVKTEAGATVTTQAISDNGSVQTVGAPG